MSYDIGVYEMNDAETEQSVTWALEARFFALFLFLMTCHWRTGRPATSSLYIISHHTTSRSLSIIGHSGMV